MKHLVTAILAVSALTAVAQPKKNPRMAPILEEGYYVTGKNDTVWGEVQTNPEDETELYRQFFFKPKNGGKVMPVSTKKAKAYGFGGRHFVQSLYEGQDVYLERLASGRLNFFEYCFQGKVNGYPGVESVYFAQDTRAEGEDVGLRQINKISTKFYKKDLRPYMKDQLMVWTDLDKFTFDEKAVTGAINEFNKYYAPTAD